MTAPRRPAWRACAVVALAGSLALALAGLSAGRRDLFLTPDQRGRWLMERQRPAEAAQAFRSSAWRGVAAYRAGDFKAAAEVFGGTDTADFAYDHGNALVMLGAYDDAVARYDRALALRPGWPDAAANRALALVRAGRLKTEGGEATEGRVAPDRIVYDKTQRGGQDQPAEGGGASAMSDEQVRALWLKRVQTRPADFLRAKFASQLQLRAAAGSPP
jgi:Ca-activated chloride channel family protein